MLAFGDAADFDFSAPVSDPNKTDWSTELDFCGIFYFGLLWFPIWGGQIFGPISPWRVSQSRSPPPTMTFKGPKFSSWPWVNYFI